MKRSESAGDVSVIELLTASCSATKKTLAEVLATEGLGMREMAAAILSGERMFPLEWLKPVAAALDIDPAFFGSSRSCVGDLGHFRSAEAYK